MLEEDEDGPQALSSTALHERDRATGRELSVLAHNPLAQVIAWQHKRDDRRAPANTAIRGLAIACLMLGIITGTITAFGSFFYDGGQRVNVLLILALFCALPLLSILGFVFATFSRDGWAAISAGQFGAIIARLGSGAKLARITTLMSGDGAPGTAKWLLLGWSQWLGLGYGAGASSVAMGLVLFTDLAFGWSTTIALSTDSLLSTVRAIALPWQTWLPQAVPDDALITSSRYFRLSTDTEINADPLELARWWPFVVMAMLCYGVLPRLATLTIARWRLRTACARALLCDTRVQRLLQRMNTPLVRTASLQTEHSATVCAATQVFVDLPAAGNWQLINWAGVPLQQTALNQLLGQSPEHASEAQVAGGTRSSAQDAELIAQLASACSADGAAAVLVIAKSWEPPTLDLMDFIGALRSALPDSAMVAVMPVAVVDGAPAPPSAAHQLTWQHALSRAQLGNVHAVALRGQPS